MKTEKRNRILTVILIVMIAVLAVLTFMVALEGFSLWGHSHEQRTVCVSTSEDGEYSIEIIAYGEPLFFSPQTVGIRIGAYGDVIRTSVANDGGHIDEKNFKISWSGHTVTVIVDGQEQYPATYRISFESQNNYSVQRVEKK